MLLEHLILYPEEISEYIFLLAKVTQLRNIQGTLAVPPAVYLILWQMLRKQLPLLLQLFIATHLNISSSFHGVAFVGVPVMYLVNFSLISTKHKNPSTFWVYFNPVNFMLNINRFEGRIKMYLFLFFLKGTTKLFTDVKF